MRGTPLAPGLPPPRAAARRWDRGGGGAERVEARGRARRGAGIARGPLEVLAVGASHQGLQSGRARRGGEAGGLAGPLRRRRRAGRGAGRSRPGRGAGPVEVFDRAGDTAPSRRPDGRTLGPGLVEAPARAPGRMSRGLRRECYLLMPRQRRATVPAWLSRRTGRPRSGPESSERAVVGDVAAR